MKIGILTYHNAINYGAVFQTYALQQFLTDKGFDTYVIDYKNKSVENQYRFKRLRLNKQLSTNLKWNIQQFIYLPAKKKNFKTWQKKFRLLKLEDKEKLKNTTAFLDKVIVGSDQVWKLKAHDYDSTFFLDFVEEKKRVSYAASFGSSNLDEQEKTYLSNYLLHIPFISVREESGVEIVKNLTGKNAVSVLDPVLLMNKDFWMSNMKNSVNRYGDYLFVYQIGSGDYLPTLCKKIANEYCLKVIYVADNLLTMLSYGPSSINKSSVGPEDFLTLLYNAKMVCTNSFHATALSLVMHKDFYTVVKGKENDLWNTRMYSLLKRFNLTNRIIQVGDKVESFSSCNFDSFDYLLKSYKNSSEEFLNTAISGEINAV
ncbi:MAG: polysaccharide pyruvyl transferase family protein [Clostridiales bacterium]|nr:polysaccharide pyruvyl transferase family protein [Clostridiales bacterium]